MNLISMKNVNEWNRWYILIDSGQIGMFNEYHKWIKELFLFSSFSNFE